MINTKWPTYEEWEGYGTERKYNERNPLSLEESNNKEERSWYGRGKRKSWINKFKFKMLKKPSGYYKKFSNFRKELEEAIEENNDEFPTQKELIVMGRSTLQLATVRYHGGLPVVRERIGYNERKRVELANELEQIILGVRNGR